MRVDIGDIEILGGVSSLYLLPGDRQSLFFKRRMVSTTYSTISKLGLTIHTEVSVQLVKIDGQQVVVKAERTPLSLHTISLN